MTAVEWLVDKLQKSKDWHRLLNEVSQMSTAKIDLINQAKEMEKEQSLKMPTYNLDELATTYFMQEWAWIKGRTEPYSDKTVEQVKKDFANGFQKAVELLTFKSE